MAAYETFESVVHPSDSDIGRERCTCGRLVQVGDRVVILSYNYPRRGRPTSEVRGCPGCRDLTDPGRRVTVRTGNPHGTTEQTFTAGEPVTLEDGTVKPAGDLKRGDRLVFGQRAEPVVETIGADALK